MRRAFLAVLSLEVLSGCGRYAAGAAAASAVAPNEPYAGAAPESVALAAQSSRSENEKAYFTNEANADAPPPPPAQMGYPQQPAPTSTPPADPAKTKPEPAAAADTARPKEFLVYTATVTLAVYQVENGLDKAEAIGRELGGYLASRGDNEIVIRVPRERFREALAQVEKLGDVLHRDVQALDVTDQFVDTESRLKNAKVMRDRLQALLAKAAVKEALEIEKELGRVTEQIEVLEGQMKSLRDRIAFSTLTVRYSSKSSGSTRTNFRLPFAWMYGLGVHRLLSFGGGQ